MSYYELVETIEYIGNFFKDMFQNFLESDSFLTIIIIVILILIIVIYKLYKRYKPKFAFFKKIEMKECQIANITIQINNRNAELAYKIYIQLITRKIGLKYEPDDILIEVYNSWYQAFQVIRQLLSEATPTNDNKYLIAICINILNNNLREHLTKYQGDFRKWYGVQSNKEEHKGFSPQELQRLYPKYDELVKDLKQNQDTIIELIKEIEKYFQFV